MLTLFPVEPVLPEGFTYTPDFLSEEEENGLIATISDIELQTFIFQGYEAKRKFASFGMDYSFTHRKLKRGNPIPDRLIHLVEKVSNHLALPPASIGELLILEYPPGAAINWHRDAPPFDIIIGLSLLSNCVFKLRPHDKNKQGRNSIISLPVGRRSLYVMRGPVRSEWQHSTAPVKDTRYSITLRTLH
ncbi:MAG TPA: alpha-ketoglutarate-dependent dioxygenase AlkB [Flavitalea sp.]|nr:alpha-ketoglutarate-dependent dioxygenase AlkB [Flavitalea sp.]